MRLIAPVLAAMLALTACSADGGGTPASTQAPSVHPISGLKVIPLTITHAGNARTFRVELAESPSEQEKGLMFRTAMGADEGMIFPMRPSRPASFWMKNTVIPLDIVYIGSDGKILNIAANAVPYSEQPLFSNGPVKGVLELIGGRTAQLGIGPGDTVEW